MSASIRRGAPRLLAGGVGRWWLLAVATCWAGGGVGPLTALLAVWGAVWRCGALLALLALWGAVWRCGALCGAVWRCMAL